MPERATLDQLAHGLHRAVTRADAKKLAVLHGHTWKALLKRMKRIGHGLRELESRVDAEFTQREPGTPVPPSPLDRVIAELRSGT